MENEDKINKLNITVGERIFIFTSMNDWKNTAKRKFNAHDVSTLDVLCVDSEGRVCVSGSEFMRAEREGTFPIWVYRAKI